MHWVLAAPTSRPGAPGSLCAVSGFWPRTATGLGSSKSLGRGCWCCAPPAGCTQPWGACGQAPWRLLPTPALLTVLISSEPPLILWSPQALGSCGEPARDLGGSVGSPLPRGRGWGAGATGPRGQHTARTNWPGRSEPPACSCCPEGPPRGPELSRKGRVQGGVRRPAPAPCCCPWAWSCGCMCRRCETCGEGVWRAGGWAGNLQGRGGVPGTPLPGASPGRRPPHWHSRRRPHTLTPGTPVPLTSGVQGPACSRNL